MTQQGDVTSQEPGSTEPGRGPGMPANPDAPPESEPASALAAEPATAAEAPGPHWPSPYPAEGQSAPEAYPAPARPGQPRYGAPGSAFQPAQSPGRAGRSGFGQPAAGQQPNAQRPYGQQSGGFGRSAQPSAMQPRDPALARPWERLLAMTMDWLVLLIATGLILYGPVVKFWHHFQALENSTLGLSQAAANTAISNFLKEPSVVSTLTSFRLVLFGLALAYFWITTAAGGATLGKRVLGLRVLSAPDRSTASVKATGIRAAVFLAGPALFVFAPGAGAFGAELTGLVGGALWLADWIAMVADQRRMTLHDRAAGTTVVRKAWLDQERKRSAAGW